MLTTVLKVSRSGDHHTDEKSETQKIKATCSGIRYISKRTRMKIQFLKHPDQDPAPKPEGSSKT
jgi:hypothetical protein